MNQDLIEIRDGLIELYDTRDPFELCRCLDIKIIETNLGDNLSGFFQRIDGEEIIYINNNIDDCNEKKYVCFHELGHVICHPELSICFLEKTLYIKDKYENEADMFAAHFLILDEDIDFSEIKDMTTKQLGSHFKVSEKLIKLRFENYL